MKQISAIILVTFALLMVSCNNQPKPMEEKTAARADNKPSLLPPYKALMVTHTVSDYDTWYAAFTAHDSVRKVFGIGPASVGRGLDNDNMVIVFSEVADIQKAHNFVSSSGLKEAMTKAGVTGTPVFSYQNVIFDDTSFIPQKERLMVTHHVKDFDAWKKVFDAEGKAIRATYGLVDRAMARGIDDPNEVTLLFAVTDMDKAKARTTSPELKKVMTDAGVDGPPQITWFRWIVL